MSAESIASRDRRPRRLDRHDAASDLALDYIENQGDNDTFADYLNDRVANE